MGWWEFFIIHFVFFLFSLSWREPFVCVCVFAFQKDVINIPCLNVIKKTKTKEKREKNMQKKKPPFFGKTLCVCMMYVKKRFFCNVYSPTPMIFLQSPTPPPSFIRSLKI